MLFIALKILLLIITLKNKILFKVIIIRLSYLLIKG